MKGYDRVMAAIEAQNRLMAALTVIVLIVGLLWAVDVWLAYRADRRQSGVTTKPTTYLYDQESRRSVR